MFQIKNLMQKKILRLKGSKNILKLNFFFQKYFGEKNMGEIGLNFSCKPDKKKIVQDTIDRKKYKSYLEIGCFDNELFDHINCEKKVGVFAPLGAGTAGTRRGLAISCLALTSSGGAGALPVSPARRGGGGGDGVGRGRGVFLSLSLFAGPAFLPSL
jgi:hypothetical protein